MDVQSLPWVEKYRPSSLDDLVAHQDIIGTIKKFIDNNKLPHLLLYGPPGTGKTSTILACAKYMYGSNFKAMVLELNASDDRGIDVVREQIKNFASTKALCSGGHKLIILDEADALTQAAQNALRRVIEQYTKNARFCLICNYVGKIIPALQSRCTRFRFSPLNQDQIQDRLQKIVDSEGINITSDGMNSLLKLSSGDMRKVLNILQAAFAGHELITDDAIYSTTGSPNPKLIEQIVDWLFNCEFVDCYNNIRNIQLENGLALIDCLTLVFDRVSTLDMPKKSRIYLLENLADIEYALSVGTSDKIQLFSMVGLFKNVLDMTESMQVVR